MRRLRRREKILIYTNFGILLQFYGTIFRKKNENFSKPFIPQFLFFIAFLSNNGVCVTQGLGFSKNVSLLKFRKIANIRCFFYFLVICCLTIHVLCNKICNFHKNGRILIKSPKVFEFFGACSAKNVSL